MGAIHEKGVTRDTASPRRAEQAATSLMCVSTPVAPVPRSNVAMTRLGFPVATSSSVVGGCELPSLAWARSGRAGLTFIMSLEHKGAGQIPQMA